MALANKVIGAYRGFVLLLGGKTEASACYDLSDRGFRESFLASLAIMLLYILLVRPIGPLQEAAWGDDLPGFMLMNVGLALVSWLPSLLAQYFVASLLRATGRYRAYVIVFNWSQVVILSVMLVVLLACQVGGLPLDILSLVDTILIVVILVFVFRATKVILEIPWYGALCMALVDLVLSKILVAVVAGSVT